MTYVAMMKRLRLVRGGQQAKPFPPELLARGPCIEQRPVPAVHGLYVYLPDELRGEQCSGRWSSQWEVTSFSVADGLQINASEWCWCLHELRKCAWSWTANQCVWVMLRRMRKCAFFWVSVASSLTLLFRWQHRASMSHSVHAKNKSSTSYLWYI